jgi:aryl-alcohol dehydrogenase-like predicted oxidoreductase
MNSVPLGNTGENVSALCLGAMYFGTRQNKKVSFNLLDQYFEFGGTFVDTANIYAHWIDGFKGGESETIIGEWMKERNNRDQVFIASKVGFGYQDVPSNLQTETIIKECEKSLRRLGVETIDIYYAHHDDRETPLEETLEAFLRLVDSGKVRFIGASNYLAWRLEEAH